MTASYRDGWTPRSRSTDALGATTSFDRRRSRSDRWRPDPAGAQSMIAIAMAGLVIEG
jgi:hypothetical protein